MTSTDLELATIRGHRELLERAGHLFASATTEFSCAAGDLWTWAARNSVPPPPRAGITVRKLFRPGLLLDPLSTGHVRDLARLGAEIRFSTDELAETILLDRRVAIVAGGMTGGERTFSVVWSPDVVGALVSLFDAAWRGATDLADSDREMVELRALAPRIIELLSSGCKDETAARTMALSVRTYRRRVAELMAALGASTRFQAGVRARDLGLV